MLNGYVMTFAHDSAIIEHQNIKLKLFDMFVSVEAARSLARRVAVYNSQLLDQMQPPAVHYAMASKILSTETAFKVASEAIQVFGGYGLSKEYHVEKIFRDARAAMIEDGSNETLAIGGADKLAAGRGTWVLQEAASTAAPGAAAQEGMTWEELEPMFRPTGVHMGVMEVDAEKCTHCGLCLENCPFRAWELDENEVPKTKEEYECFSCYNCMAVCPTGAISIVKPYYVEDGSFYETQGGPLPAKMPYEPKDAEGNTDEWTVVEREIFERRSVRNFKPDPIPETLIRRLKRVRASPVRNPKSVSESSRTTSLVYRKVSSPTRSSSRSGAGTWTWRPTPPNSITR